MTIPTPVIGANCHLTLSHPNVNNAEPFGFLLRLPVGEPEHTIAIQRERSSDGASRVKVFFDLLLADGLINPDGSRHAPDRGTSYAMLLAFLEQEGEITLANPTGVISGLGALGHSATELHFPARIQVSCQLSNVGSYFPPVPFDDFQASVWDGERNWALAYWR